MESAPTAVIIHRQLFCGFTVGDDALIVPQAMQRIAINNVGDGVLDVPQITLRTLTNNVGAVIDRPRWGQVGDDALIVPRAHTRVRPYGE